MATPSPMRRAPATVVGVDVTMHKEARHITDVKRSSHQSRNTRIRYYVELVVGSPHDNHTRLGFSGTFKALLRLHAAFESRFNAKYAIIKATTRESVSSATSASSVSSGASHRRASAPAEMETIPKIIPFPTSNALLVKLQPRQHVESDDKAKARCDALFTYYTRLFNSEEREMYLDYIQSRAETIVDNQYDHAQGLSVAEAATEKRGFLKKLFGLRRGDGVEAPRNERERVAALDAKLEFAAPVHVAKKKHRRRN